MVPKGTIVVGGLFTGVRLNALSLQTVTFCVGINGCAPIDTVTVNGVPGQPPDNGVTVYVSVASELVILLKVWLICVCPVACALPPVIAPTGLLTGAVQVYVVPAGTMVVGALSTGIITNALSLQIAINWFGTTGVGSTVTVNVNGVPGQAPDNGVTVYVSVAVALVVLVNTWLILVCPVACALPPVIAPTGLLTGAVQVYVVPAGTIVAGALFKGVTVNVLSPHIVAVCAGITGVGSTVTVTVNGVPGQLPAAPEVGVTV